MHGALNGVLVNIGGQGNGPRHTGTGIARRIHDFRNGLIQNAVIVGFELDPNAIAANSCHCAYSVCKNTPHSHMPDAGSLAACADHEARPEGHHTLATDGTRRHTGLRKTRASHLKNRNSEDDGRLGDPASSV